MNHIKSRTERDYLEEFGQALAPWRDALIQMLITSDGESELEVVNRAVPEIRRTVYVKLAEREVTVWTSVYGEVAGGTFEEKAETLARAMRVFEKRGQG